MNMNELPQIAASARNAAHVTASLDGAGARAAAGVSGRGSSDTALDPSAVWPTCSAAPRDPTVILSGRHGPVPWRDMDGSPHVAFGPGTALVVVDMQNDFA